MVNNKYKKIIEFLGENRIKTDFTLGPLTTFRIGGPADLYYIAYKSEEIIAAIKTAKSLSVPYFVIGGGTNILVSDDGFHGLVIKNESSGIKILAYKGKVHKASEETKFSDIYIEADSGVGVNRLVRYSLDKGLAGLELFLGQPGTVGGAVYINAHNMKRRVFWGEKVYQARIVKEDGTVTDVPAEYFKFDYDKSILQETKETLLSVVMKLSVGNKDKLWAEATDVVTYRAETQPKGKPTAGCTFRNIDKSDAMRIATPEYTCSAGYLIDKVGLKGYQVGNAKFSDQHANFILNLGRATASDVLNLINLAKEKVKDKFGVTLKEEIVLVGNF